MASQFIVLISNSYKYIYMKQNDILRRKHWKEIWLKCQNWGMYISVVLNSKGKYPKPLKYFTSTVPLHTFSKLFQLCTGHGVLGRWFQMRYISKWYHYCKRCQLETVENVLKKCPLHPAERDLLRKVSSDIGPRILLDTKKELCVVLKFTVLLPQFLCGWFAQLEELVEAILGINLWYWSTRCYVSQVSLNTWNYSWRIQCRRKCERIIRADTTILPASWRQMPLKIISFLYVILFYDFVCDYLI